MIFKVRKDKMLEFINEYEPIWYELCELYDLGNRTASNNISKTELNCLDLEITLEKLNDNDYKITCVNHKDNDCVVYSNDCINNTDDSINDWLEYLELI